ncbi:MAG: NAD-dependent epimerase/dehydratase family protein [Lachnospiraceae bacterium]|nr:NAD-dependent epimerase/dehydratase family protein [Lachnospiraceae bacterium]
MESVLTEDLRELAESSLPVEEFRDSTFLITGATGLVGSLLVRALLTCNRVYHLNLRVLAVVRNVEKARGIFGETESALDYVTADLATDELEIEEKIDYVVHAAAVTASRMMVEDPLGTIRTAIYGTDTVLQLAAKKKVRACVYLSSIEVYGQPSVSGKTTEKDLGYVDPGVVRSCYPEGKRMCECLCTAYVAQYGLNVIIARLAQTFGAGTLPGENRVFAQFARSILRGTDIVLHTSGESEGNYVYTMDAVYAILLLLTAGEKGMAYNISNEESHTTIREMAELVAHEIADDRIRVVIDIPKDAAALGYAPPVKMWLDSSRMRSLGWRPRVGLLDSYRRLIRWMRENNER